MDASGGANIVDADARLDAFDTGVRDSYATDRTTEMTDQDHISVPVHEEEREIDVQVTEERVKGTVRKEHVDVDQSGDVDITATSTKWNEPGLRS